LRAASLPRLRARASTRARRTARKTLRLAYSTGAVLYAAPREGRRLGRRQQTKAKMKIVKMTKNQAGDDRDVKMAVSGESWAASENNRDQIDGLALAWRTTRGAACDACGVHRKNVGAAAGAARRNIRTHNARLRSCWQHPLCRFKPPLRCALPSHARFTRRGITRMPPRHNCASIAHVPAHGGMCGLRCLRRLRAPRALAALTAAARFRAAGAAA